MGSRLGIRSCFVLVAGAMFFSSCGIGSGSRGKLASRWIDRAGNLYIADSGNNVIRKVDIDTGVISTVAGNGFGSGYSNVGNASSGGYSGDGGLATSAMLYYPLDVAFDSSGNLYIADAGNNVVRKVDVKTKFISTYAGNGANPTTNPANAWGVSGGYRGDGGPATQAELSWPSAILFDKSDNLYIADTGNNVIRKVDSTSGIITTVAGNGVGARTGQWGHGSGGFSGDGGPATSAELNWPAGIGIDELGNLYIADTQNCRIRKVDGQTGMITTIAGSGQYSSTDTWPIVGINGPAILATISWPTGIALDHSGNIYVANVGAPVAVIDRIDVSSGVITNFSGTPPAGYSGDGGPAALAQLNYPCTMAVDMFGNVYIADDANYAIRKVDHITGIISTVAGSGIEGYSGDGGQATSANLSSPFDTGG